MKIESDKRQVTDSSTDKPDLSGFPTMILVATFLFELLGGLGVLGGSILVLLFLAVRSGFIGVYRRSSAAHSF